MRLRHLADGPASHVWAVADDSGDCQVLSRLEDWQPLYPGAVDRLMSLLFDVVPARGVPDDPTLVKPLYRRLVWEFREWHYTDERRQMRREMGLRVAFFFDGPSLVVCTNAFEKWGSTPDDHKWLAVAERQRYLDSRAMGQLRIDPLSGG